jgi:hypothetical protein
MGNLTILTKYPLNGKYMRMNNKLSTVQSVCTAQIYPSLSLSNFTIALPNVPYGRFNVVKIDSIADQDV